MPLVTAAAPPPLLPPAERPRSQGLRVTPNTVLKVCDPAPNSGTLLLPTMTAPAGAHALHHQVVVVGDGAAEDGRAAGGGQPGHVDQVLDRDRQPGERTRFGARREFRVDRCRRRRGTLGIQGADGVDPWVEALDLRQVCCQQLAGAQVPRPHQGRLLHGR